MKHEKKDFDVITLEDELRVDALCKELLMSFYREKLQSGMDETEATLLANSADFFVRDFVIGIRQKNLLQESPGLVRSFAGNWYIVNTLEPMEEELAGHLKGIREFYHYLRRQGLIEDSFVASIDRECMDLPYYASRIESFWNISGGGYYGWEAECSLKS